MPSNIQPNTLEILNKVVRYMHFDPGAKGQVHNIGTLSIELRIQYPTLYKVMRDKKFTSVFTRNMLGGLVLSGVIPEFLEEFIDFDTPYVPVYRCDDPTHTHGMNDKPASPQNQKQSKPQVQVFKTEYYDAAILRAIIHEAKWTELIALGHVEPYKAPIKGNKAHIYNQFRNTANVILRTLDLLSAKDPAEKAKEILTDPDEFPPLPKIIRARQTDHVPDTPEAITADPVTSPAKYVPQVSVPDPATVMCPRMRAHYLELSLGRVPFMEQNPNTRSISDLAQFLRAPQEETIRPGCPAVVWRGQQYDKDEIAYCLERLDDTTAPNDITIKEHGDVDFELLKIELHDALNGGTYNIQTR